MKNRKKVKYEDRQEGWKRRRVKRKKKIEENEEKGK